MNPQSRSPEALVASSSRAPRRRKRLVTVFSTLLLLSAACSGRADFAGQPTETPQPILPSASDTPAPIAPAIEPLNAAWNRYTNPRLGISLRVPKTMIRFDAECVWSDEAGGGSYRPSEAAVPVIVLEGGNRVVITSQTFSLLTLPTQVPSGAGYHYKYAGCERLQTDLELARMPGRSTYLWDIGVYDVHSRADLEHIIDEEYGECFHLGDLTPTEMGDMLNVRVLGDGKPVEESECLLRGGYVFLYSPEHARAATWKTGQALHFLYDAQKGEGYDQEMHASFRFIP